MRISFNRPSGKWLAVRDDGALATEGGGWSKPCISDPEQEPIRGFDTYRLADDFIRALPPKE